MATIDLPETMRAIQWTSTAGGIEHNLTLNPSAPLPKAASPLASGNTLVRIAYTSVNPADIKVPEMPIATHLAFAKPAVPCMDFSGTVVRTANPALQAGDRVFGKTEPPVFGACAEYAVVGPKGCVRLPAGASLRDAAGLGVCGLTAYQTLRPFLPTDPAAAGGMKVLINGGSGGVGTFAIQIAKILGCGHVAATCSGPNVELCASLGADDVIDYRTTDLVAELTRRGTQYDLLVDNVNVGGKPLYWNAHHYLKEGGSYVCIAGDVSPTNILHLLQMFLLPRWLGGGQRTPKFVMCASNVGEYAELGSWIAEGKLRTVVEEVYELAEAGKAFARSKTGRSRGKVLIRVCGE